MTPRGWLVRVGAIVAIVFPFRLAIQAAGAWPVDPAVASYSVVVITFAVVGPLVSERRPANVVGPLPGVWLRARDADA